jgi:hypothetical protein
MARNTGNPPGRIERWRRAQVLPFRSLGAIQTKMALQAPATSKMPAPEVSRDSHVYVIPRRCNGNATAAGVEFPDHTEGVLLNAGEIFDPNAHALEETNAQLRHFAHALRHDLQELLRMVKNEGEPGEEADKCNAYSMEGALRIEALLKALLTYLEITGFAKRGRMAVPGAG